MKFHWARPGFASKKTEILAPRTLPRFGAGRTLVQRQATLGNLQDAAAYVSAIAACKPVIEGVHPDTLELALEEELFWIASTGGIDLTRVEKQMA